MEDDKKIVDRAYEMINDPKYADLFDPDKTDADTNPLYDADDKELSPEDAAAVRYARKHNLYERVNEDISDTAVEARETAPSEPVTEVPEAPASPRETIEDRNKNPWML